MQANRYNLFSIFLEFVQVRATAVIIYIMIVVLWVYTVRFCEMFIVLHIPMAILQTITELSHSQLSILLLHISMLIIISLMSLMFREPFIVL